MLGGIELLLDKLLVTNYGDNSINIIDRKDLSIIASVDLKEILSKETGCTRLLLDSDYRVLVLDTDNDSLYRIDILRKKMIGHVKLGRCPIRMLSYKDRIFVLNMDSNSLTIVDRKDLHLIENINLGEKPMDMAIDRIKGKLFISNLNGYGISIVDCNGGDIKEFRLSFMPFRIKEELGLVYILGFSNNNTLGESIISALDLKKEEILWQKKVRGIYYDFIKDNGKDYYYLVNSEDGWLYIFNKASEDLRKELYIGGLTNYIISDGYYLYLNDLVNDKLVIVDKDKMQIKKRITVGIEPHDILLT